MFDMPCHALFFAYDMTAKKLPMASSSDIYFWIIPGYSAFGIEHAWDNWVKASADRVFFVQEAA